MTQLIGFIRRKGGAIGYIVIMSATTLSHFYSEKLTNFEFLVILVLANILWEVWSINDKIAGR